MRNNPTPEAQHQRQIGRSVLAVFAGFVVVVVLSLLTDVALYKAGMAPPEPMVHALIGGFIGLVLSIVGIVVSWNHVTTMGPRWYPISLVITAFPAAWLGGRFRVMQLQNSAYK